MESLKTGEQLHLIDVREAAEVCEGMIPGSVNIPLSSFINKLDTLNKQFDYIIICHSGARSGQVALYLTRQGYKARNLIGGMMAWFGPLEYNS